MNVHFSENNSGGSWWLDESHYNALAAAGWEVGDRRAKKKFNSLEEGEKEWEYLTGRNSNEWGCECCGQPYQFWDEGE